MEKEKMKAERAEMVGKSRKKVMAANEHKKQKKLQKRGMKTQDREENGR